ncbi:MAG: T9SS type A sorting domain-containing protein [Schleiferiaceae bacterium]
MAEVRRWAAGLWLLVGSVVAQPVEQALVPWGGAPAATRYAKTTTDTLNLPLSAGFDHRIPSGWTSRGVVVSQTMARKPLSLGVAVFDGISASGAPYRPGVYGTDTLGDALFSPWFSAPAGAVVSFRLQQGGFGDPCELSDSMVVHAWNSADTAWVRLGGIRGGLAEDRWKAYAFAVPSTAAGAATRLRIGRHGAPSGAFDVFLLDYLELSATQGLGDTLLFDPTWISPPARLTNVYREVPWFHYNRVLLERDSVRAPYRRNGVVPVGGWQLNLGKLSWTDGSGTLIQSRTTVPVVSNLLHNVATSYNLALNRPQVQPSAPFAWNLAYWFDGEAVGDRSNDTVYVRTEFGARYVVDDGSCERGYGVAQGNQPRWAQKFQFLQADTLRGADLEWIPAGPQGEGERFRLGVWAVDSAGFPGDPLYVSDSLYEVAWNYAGQLGRHYVLDTAGLVVPRDVYVGVVMETSNSDQGMPRAVLGLDVHTTAVKAFGEQGEWFLSQLPGALALRPFFRGTPGDLGTAKPTAPPVLKVYPVPARDQLVVEGAAKRLEVINLLGAVVLRAERAEDSAPWILDVRGLPAGAYVLRSEAGQPLRFVKQ